MSKQICFILDWYPTPSNNGCVFAKHLICAIADQGFDCVVIAPRIKNAHTEKIPYERKEKTETGNPIKVFTPSYLHFSSRKQTMKLSMNNHFRAVMKVIKKENLHPDAIYGHFIYQCGLTAARVGKELEIPSYCASGESYRLVRGCQPYTNGLDYCNWTVLLGSLTGVISVSAYNKALLLENGFFDSEMPIEIFPNGYDKKKFYQIEKNIARKKLELPKEIFIIAFVGRFVEAKGINELCEAINQFDDVYSLFIGGGETLPNCKNILFCGRIPNDEVVWYLNAADIFVLPTKSEGCCNAIIEAMACGLPVISSDLPFNDEILNQDNSIKIDVNDVDQIASAIKKLKDNKGLRDALAEGAYDFSTKLDINTRAKNIISFMRLNNAD